MTESSKSKALGSAAFSANRKVSKDHIRRFEGPQNILHNKIHIVFAMGPEGFV